MTRHAEHARFEAAADAIVGGDLATLRRLLAEDPGLVHRRSARAHRSTLLHYVSANGVEGERQKTPPNVVEIAALLLDGGADVNAESDAYGGGATTLMLAATSIHPLRAGVQDALMQLLLDRGAVIEHAPGQIVNACLANGRGAAAEFLAARGAGLDFEGAAGLGRLDLVEQLFDEAPKEKIEAGFLWACEYGRNDVVAYLLDRRLHPAAGADRGMTGLHWAAHAGQLATVELLLARKAPLDVKNVHGGTPLGQAEWSAANDPQPDHPRIIELLRAATRA